MNNEKMRLIVILREDETVLKQRWEDLKDELGLSMADTIRYMIRETWKREVKGGDN